ncbi:36.4 kDa proline-rich protein-like [Prosopis cineraria]|uniref:36.4 kDa proline-rich protein-like n=1 Tax=Prosopis cineraria TaxID=364024 RepID=UPI00240F10F6|nr:36.4 kDa proline-rich protein-like [Prosopis cineraria]XP_054807285.1 36.4 kDa proline-rich protein-like [Prosopis cineraria]
MMISSKIYASLIICLLFISSSATPSLGCTHCSRSKPPKRHQKPPKLPPRTLPLPPPAHPAEATCPVDTVKLGACVDLLGGLVHIGIGNPVMNQCCPVLAGLVDLEAAVCLCTTLKLKLLNLDIYVPLALQLLITCGKIPPPGYTCSL